MSIERQVFFVCDHCGEPCNQGLHPSATRAIEFYRPRSRDFKTRYLAFCERCGKIDVIKDATVLAALKEIHSVLQTALSRLTARLSDRAHEG